MILLFVKWTLKSEGALVKLTIVVGNNWTI